MKFYARQKRTPTVIIVSLIDIFAILLIFVIVTTTFKQVQPEVTIKLPESTTASPSEQTDTPLRLTITRDSKVFVGNEVTPIDLLKPALQQAVAEAPQRRIAMRADTDAPFGLIIKVLDILKEAGVSSSVSAFTDEAK